MYADRYARPEGIKPGSLTIAIAINGALIAALLFSSPVVEKYKERVLQTENIFLDPPPPPEPVPPVVKPQPQQKTTAAAEQIDTSSQVVTGVTAPYTPPPLPDFGTLTGTGGGSVEITPLRPPQPVLTEATVDPRHAALFQPDYPPGERRAEREGKVVIRVLIGIDGRVRQVERLSADSDQFWRATEQRALDKWRFRPATRDGVPIEAWRTMTVRFEMER